MAITAYSCINCGSNVKFDIASKAFKCDACHSRYTLEQMNQAFPDDTQGNLWNRVQNETSESREFTEDHVNNASEKETSVEAYDCPQCGAEVMADSNTLASSLCVFCGKPVTISHRLLSGDSLPSRVIPFAVTQQEAFEIFQQKLKNKPLLPFTFKSYTRAKDFKSVYVPFKLFDADCSANIVADCKIVTTWSDSNYNYTKTDTYEARRSGEMEFAQVPADASDKISSEEMEAIEPFNMSDLMAFSKKYLSGHYAEAPTTREDVLRNELYRRLKPAAERETLGTIYGYTSVRLKSGNVAVNKATSEYVMLPVWMYLLKYKDKEYAFTVNGQTGKFTGKLPVDRGYALKLYIVIALLVFILAFIGLEVYLWVS